MHYRPSGSSQIQPQRLLEADEQASAVSSRAGSMFHSSEEAMCKLLMCSYFCDSPIRGLSNISKPSWSNPPSSRFQDMWIGHQNRLFWNFFWTWVLHCWLHLWLKEFDQNIVLRAFHRFCIHLSDFLHFRNQSLRYGSKTSWLVQLEVRRLGFNTSLITPKRKIDTQSHLSYAIDSSSRPLLISI